MQAPARPELTVPEVTSKASMPLYGMERRKRVIEDRTTLLIHISTAAGMRRMICWEQRR